jgi:transcriptional regulator with XRE-family HTH domain
MQGPELLKRWRKAEQLSQKAAGSRVGVGQNTWSDWEAGRKAPRVTHAVRIEKVTEGKVPVRAWDSRPSSLPPALVA